MDIIKQSLDYQLENQWLSRDFYGKTGWVKMRGIRKYNLVPIFTYSAYQYGPDKPAPTHLFRTWKYGLIYIRGCGIFM